MGGVSWVCVFLFAFHLVFLGASAAWGKTYVVAIRGSEQLVAADIARYAEYEFLTTETKEFENGNTFVRYKKSPMGNSVEIRLPAQLTPDQLMEALIKARIARAEGALRVTIVSAPCLDDVQLVTSQPFLFPLSLRRLFRAAGADFTQDGVGELNPLPEIHRRGETIFPFESVVTGETHPELRDRLASELAVPVVPLVGDHWKRPKLVYHVSPAIFPVNEVFFRTLSEIIFLRRHHNKVVLVSPYQPYARSDKKDQPGVAITGRLVADLIESAGTDMFVFVRAHAPQTEGFYSIPVVHITGRETISAYLRSLGVEMIISPDAGFQKDATLYAQDLGVPVDVLNKQRNLETGEGKHHHTNGLSVEGKIVAVPDDETSSGGTMSMSAEELKARGAKMVIGVVTHLTGSAKKALESGALDLLVVTDTNPVSIPPSAKFKVLSIAHEISAHLRDLQNSVGCAQNIAAVEQGDP